MRVRVVAVTHIVDLLATEVGMRVLVYHHALSSLWHVLEVLVLVEEASTMILMERVKELGSLAHVWLFRPDPVVALLVRDGRGKRLVPGIRKELRQVWLGLALEPLVDSESLLPLRQVIQCNLSFLD